MNREVLFIILTFISLFGFKISSSQNISVQAKLDTNIITIGDQIHLSLEVKQPKNTKIKFPFLNDTIVDKVEIINSSEADTTETFNKNQILIRKKYLITSFDSGIYIIPNFKFAFKSFADSTIDTISTTPMYFGVQTVMLDTAHPKQIADIKKPYKASLTFREVLPWALLSYFILFIISFSVYYFEKKKKNEPIFIKKPKPPKPPHIIAYKELEKLKRDKLWQKNKVKEYHSRLTEILRVYIEKRFLIRAMEQTSDEILTSFSNTGLIDSVLFESLEKVLKLADMVKFAKALPLADENEMSLKIAYRFIDRTKQSLITTEKNNETVISDNEISANTEEDKEIKALSDGADIVDNKQLSKTEDNNE